MAINIINLAGVEGFGHVPRPRSFAIDGGISQQTAPPLAYSDKYKYFQNFTALHRPPNTFCCTKHSGRSDPYHNKENTLRLKNLRVFSWLGWRDSNPRMPVPKTGALPLGDTPL